MLQTDQRPPIGHLIHKGLSLYQVAFRQLFLLALIGGVVMVSFNRLIGQMQLDSLHRLILHLLASIPFLYFKLALLCQLNAVKQGKTAAVTMALEMANRKFLPFLMTSLLCFLILFGGLLLFIVPGVVAYIFTFFASFLILFTDKSPIDAIKLSVKIVRPQWWRCFAVIMLAVLMAFTVNLLLASVLMLLRQAIPIVSLANMVSYVGSILIAAIITPIPLAIALILLDDVQCQPLATDEPVLA